MNRRRMNKKGIYLKDNNWRKNRAFKYMKFLPKKDLTSKLSITNLFQTKRLPLKKFQKVFSSRQSSLILTQAQTTKSLTLTF